MLRRSEREVFLGLAIGAVVYLSLYPFRFEDPLSWHVVWSAAETRKDWVDVVVNILFYLPVGAAVASFWLDQPRKALVVAATASFVLSYVVETGQLAIPGRISNLRDTLWNTVGGLVGAILAIRLPWKAGHGIRIGHPAGVWTICWIFWLAFPFMPALRMWKLQQMKPTMGLWPDVLMAGDLLCCGATLAMGLGRRLWWLTAGLWAVAAYGGLLPGRAFSWAEIGLAGLGLGWGFRQERATWAWAALLTGWLLFREVFPLAWTTEPTPFQWTPLAVSFGLPIARAVPVLAGKIMFYSMVFWAWVQAGSRSGTALTILMGALALGEYLQRHIPGRQPDVTDFLLALAAAGLITWRPERAAEFGAQ